METYGITFVPGAKTDAKLLRRRRGGKPKRACNPISSPATAAYTLYFHVQRKRVARRSKRVLRTALDEPCVVFL